MSIKRVGDYGTPAYGERDFDYVIHWRGVRNGFGVGRATFPTSGAVLTAMSDINMRGGFAVYIGIVPRDEGPYWAGRHGPEVRG